MDPREQLTAIVPTLEELVDLVQPWQLTDPTPCSEFAVRDVLDHMIVLGGSFAYLFRGEDPAEPSVPDVAGWVPADEFRTAMDDLLAAVHTPGAMERTVHSPLGDLPGETFARFVAFDGLVHGFDLASATGLDFEVSADVVADVDAFARQALTDDLRDGDTFADATEAPATATPLERLAAFSGRTV